MATFTLSDIRFYTGGVEESSSKIVGFANSKNRVVRYTFTTDAVGASSVSFSVERNYEGDGTLPGLRWYIGTSSTSHANAGATSEYCGNITVTENSGEYAFSGSADIVLLPNTTYYLWLFPSVTNYGYYYVSENRTQYITTSGGAGLVYIDNGSNIEAYQCYIGNGTGWDLCLPHIDNGSEFKLHS